MFYQMLQLDCHYLTKHAQVFMKELGITYKHAVPQSIADCWQFWCCEVPDNIILPEIISYSKVNPVLFVGYGLSDEKAMELADILGYDYQIEDGCLIGGINHAKQGVTKEQIEYTIVDATSDPDLINYEGQKAYLYICGHKLTGFVDGGLIKIEKDETKC